MMTRFLPLLALAAATSLTACSENAARFPVETAPATASAAPVRLRVATIELRDVVLPAYAEDSQMQLRNAEGALVTLEGAQWAAPSAQAMTAELARGLDLGSTASVAAEPWPLSEPAQMRLVILQDENLRAAHAILAVRLDDVYMILDNQVDAVLPDTQILHYRPVYSLNESGWWLHHKRRFVPS